MRNFINIITEALSEYERAFRAHPYASQHFASVDDFVDEMRSLDPSEDHRYTNWLCRAFLADDGQDGMCQGGPVEVTPDKIRDCLSQFAGDIEQFPTITSFVGHCLNK